MDARSAGSPPSAAAPAVCVLLATHNGMPWIREQADSLVAQERVAVSVVVSDDGSTDDTLAVLAERLATIPLTVLPPQAGRFGNANRNFMRLIAEAPIGSADFVALCDQDDVWLPAKLSRAVEVLASGGCDAYSSDVIAFWPDGRRRPLHKAGPQKPYDHLFESAGPGCTFVFPTPVFAAIRSWVQADRAGADRLRVHDWALYALARTRGWRWFIDPRPGVFYRQHDRNEVGANVGLQAAVGRMKKVLAGAFWADVLGVADTVGVSGEAVQRLRRLSLADRIWLVAHVGQFRRRPAEAAALAALLLLGKRQRSLAR